MVKRCSIFELFFVLIRTIHRLHVRQLTFFSGTDSFSMEHFSLRINFWSKAPHFVYSSTLHLKLHTLPSKRSGSKPHYKRKNLWNESYKPRLSGKKESINLYVCYFTHFFSFTLQFVNCTLHCSFRVWVSCHALKGDCSTEAVPSARSGTAILKALVTVRMCYSNAECQNGSNVSHR